MARGDRGVGVNSGNAVLRELGGYGHVAYTLVGDTIDLGSRLEGKASSCPTGQSSAEGSVV